MATLRDTMIHDTLAVIENIVLSDYKYNVVKDNNGLIYGQSDYPTTIYGSTLTLSATNFILTTTGYQQFNAGTTFDATSAGNMSLKSTGGTFTAQSSGAMTLTSGGALTETAATNIALTASSGTFAASSTGNMTLSTTSSGYILLSSKTYIKLDATTNIQLAATTYINISAATYAILSAAGGYLQINNTYDSNGDGTANTAGYVRVRSQYSYVQITSDVSYIQLTASTYVKINSRFVVASTKCYGTSAPTADSQGSYTGQVYFRIVS